MVEKPQKYSGGIIFSIILLLLLLLTVQGQCGLKIANPKNSFIGCNFSCSGDHDAIFSYFVVLHKTSDVAQNKKKISMRSGGKVGKTVFLVTKKSVVFAVFLTTTVYKIG